MTFLPNDITQMLVDGCGGDRAAFDRLMPLVYDELRRLADGYLRRERPGHTLSSTALVHEAYLRMVDQTRVRWQGRAHFFGIAANLMRQILINHAHHHRAARRGGDIRYTLSLDETAGWSGGPEIDLVALDDALNDLTALDPQKARIVELRFFAGLSVEETAAVLGVSARTINREWRLAKVWLYNELKK